MTFHGHVSETEKHRLLARAWVHAMPSLKEGWGLVVVEAGVHGTPTVAFRSAGGPADSIVDGETGLLVDDADGEPDVHGLHARRWRPCSPTARDAEQMSEDARRWVARFRWEDCVDAWERPARGGGGALTSRCGRENGPGH